MYIKTSYFFSPDQIGFVYHFLKHFLSNRPLTSRRQSNYYRRSEFCFLQIFASHGRIVALRSEHGVRVVRAIK